MQIDLTPFCFPKEWAEAYPQRLELLGTPFSFGRWTVATDGRILVAVPRQADVPERAVPDYMARVFNRYFEVNPAQGNPVIVRSLVIPPAWFTRKCTDCGETGRKSYCEPDGRQFEMDCPTCEGDGVEWEEVQAVQFRRHRVSHLYLNRLAALPECRMWDAPDGEALPFEFADGGMGRLCTLRPA